MRQRGRIGEMRLIQCPAIAETEQIVESRQVSGWRMFPNPIWSILNNSRGDTAAQSLTFSTRKMTSCTDGVRRHISLSAAVDSARGVGNGVAVGIGVGVGLGVGVGRIPMIDCVAGIGVAAAVSVGWNAVAVGYGVAGVGVGVAVGVAQATAVSNV